MTYLLYEWGILELSKEYLNIIGRNPISNEICLYTGKDLKDMKEEEKLMIFDQTISRYEPKKNKYGSAIIEYEKDKDVYTISPSPNSLNPVLLNRKRIDNKEKLKDNDSIIIGNTEFIFVKPPFKIPFKIRRRNRSFRAYIKLLRNSLL